MSSETEHLEPHQRLLLCSVQSSTPSPVEVENLLAGGLDWRELAGAARLNRLISFVFRLLRQPTIAPLVDSSIREKWSELNDGELKRVGKKLSQLREVGQLMEGAGVEALVYKGPDFSRRFYAEDCPRAFNDLDIVVRRQAVPATIRALEAAGYHLPPGTPPLEYYLRFHLHAIYLHPLGGHPVEVHWALESPYSPLPDIVPELLAEAEPGPELGPALLRPAPVDTLALMVLHLEKHLGTCASLPGRGRRLQAILEEGGLFWVLDVLLWLRLCGPLSDARTVLDRMRRLWAERALLVALRLALDVDAGSVPDWARQLGERLPGPTPLVARFVYPDLPEPMRKTVRRLLAGTLPVVAFRPSRVLEMLLPTPRVPGVALAARPSRRATFAARWWLAARNVWALLAWKIGSVMRSTAQVDDAGRSRGHP